jgi:hypothetical protein
MQVAPTAHSLALQSSNSSGKSSISIAWPVCGIAQSKPADAVPASLAAIDAGHRIPRGSRSVAAIG